MFTFYWIYNSSNLIILCTINKGTKTKCTKCTFELFEVHM
jgi:hypothetical protein